MARHANELNAIGELSARFPEFESATRMSRRADQWGERYLRETVSVVVGELILSLCRGRPTVAAGMRGTRSRDMYSITRRALPKAAKSG